MRIKNSTKCIKLLTCSMIALWCPNKTFDANDSEWDLNSNFQKNKSEWNVLALWNTFDVYIKCLELPGMEMPGKPHRLKAAESFFVRFFFFYSLAVVRFRTTHRCCGTFRFLDVAGSSIGCCKVFFLATSAVLYGFFSSSSTYSSHVVWRKRTKRDMCLKKAFVSYTSEIQMICHE